MILLGINFSPANVRVHCNKTCQNGGTLDAETCVCNCTGDFSGSSCEGECVERVHACNHYKLNIIILCGVVIQYIKCVSSFMLQV